MGSRQNVEWGGDLNGDNLRIYRVCLRISDHCRVTVTVRVRVIVRVSLSCYHLELLLLLFIFTFYVLSLQGNSLDKMWNGADLRGGSER